MQEFYSRFLQNFALAMCYTLPIKFIINSFPKRNSLQYPLQAVFSFYRQDCCFLSEICSSLIFYWKMLSDIAKIKII